jgi:hypothetical protein
MTVERKDYTFEEILLLLEMEPFRSESTGYRLLEMQERIDNRDIEIIRLKNQLTTLTWAAHIPLSLPVGEAMTACDIGVLRSEVDSAEELLGGAKP